MATSEELAKSLADFRANNPWIYDLINLFNDKYQPIEWEKLPAGIKDSYVQKYLVYSYTAAKATYSTLDFDPAAITSQEATDAAKEIFDQTKSTYDKVKAAASIGWETLTGQGEGLEILSDALLIFVGTTYTTLEKGFMYHYSGAAKEFLDTATESVNVQIGARKISYADGAERIKNIELALQYHAQAIQGGFSAIAYLDKEGYLSRMKKPGLTGADGLGVVPVAMVVGGLVAIAAIAWAIVAIYQTMSMNKLIEEQCSKFKSESARAVCIKSAVSKSPSVNLSDMTSGITQWLVYGALIAGGVYFAPVIVSSIKGAAKAAKA